MKILHTADWHLGKKLYSHSRMEEQKKVLQEIIHIADQENVDLVIIAGDVFDSLLPPLEAEELYYQTIKKLSDRENRLVVVIAGNHDAPDKITAAAPLAITNNILLLGYPRQELRYKQLAHFQITKSAPGFVEIQHPQMPLIRLLLTPFVNESRWNESPDSDLDWANRDLWLQNQMIHHWNDLAAQYIDQNGVNLLVAHLFLSEAGGTKYSETEDKQILRGTLFGMDSSHLPDSLQYTALGHLHQMHSAGKNAWYSGSPVAYSFSEAEQDKFVLIVEIDPGKPAIVKPVKLQSTNLLRRRNCFSFDEIDALLEEFPNDLFEIQLTIQQQSMDSRYLYYKQHPRLIHIIANVQNKIDQVDKLSIEDLARSDEELFARFYVSQKNVQPSSEIMELFKEVILRNQNHSEN